jgi:hypothetical protein
MPYFFFLNLSKGLYPKFSTFKTEKWANNTHMLMRMPIATDNFLQVVPSSTLLTTHCNWREEDVTLLSPHLWYVYIWIEKGGKCKINKEAPIIVTYTIGRSPAWLSPRKAAMVTEVLGVSYVKMLLASSLYGVGWYHDWWSGRKWKGSGLGLIVVLFRKFTGGTEWKHRKP